MTSFKADVLTFSQLADILSFIPQKADIFKGGRVCIKLTLNFKSS